MTEFNNIKNRQQRRAEKKKELPASPPAFHATFTEALQLHQAGRLADAEKLYRQVLVADANHADSLHLLGVIAYQARRHDAAVELISRAIEVKDDEAIYYGNLGVVLKDQGKLDEAVASYDRALALKPDFAGAHSNRGLALHDLGKLDEAVASYDRALAIRPDSAEAHNNRGNALRDRGKPDEAVASFDRALAIKPDFAEAHNNRGAALEDKGKLEEAASSYDKALAIKPDYAEAHNNRGNVFRQQGKPDEAIASYDRALAIKPLFAVAHSNRGNVLKDQSKLDEAVASYNRALAIKPDFAEALNNLALTTMEQGKAMMALNIINQSLRAKETPEAKGLFVTCVKRLRGMPNDREIQATTIRALTEPWGRPGDLAGHAIDLIKRNPDIASCVARAADAWPNRMPARELVEASGFTALATDPLLIVLLETTTACDIDMEYFLATARAAMLEVSMNASSSTNGNGTMLRFYTALARQCFINEYVWSSTEDEKQRASTLRTSLVAAVGSGTEIPVLWLIAVASYFPLWSIAQATRLLEREWPPEVVPLLVQQIREPMEEVELRATIPRLTDVEGEVSLEVQKQYEENPYPRWIRMAPGAKATNIYAYWSCPEWWCRRPLICPPERPPRVRRWRAGQRPAR